jgi:hypothetical protein
MALTVAFLTRRNNVAGNGAAAPMKRNKMVTTAPLRIVIC